MNTLHLAYAVEVERCGSITQAAENLYMAQPNLSKAIKELEESMGFPIFARTSRGVMPTLRGREFLVYARAILAEVDKMETLRPQEEPPCLHFSLVLPATGPAADCVSQLLDTLPDDQPPDLLIEEGSAAQAVEAVAAGRARMGIARCAAGQERAFSARLRENGLTAETLWEYDALLLLGARHPLAAAARIPADSLSAFTQITDSDAPAPRSGQNMPSAGRVRVSGRHRQLELLSRLPGSYLWSAPEPPETLRCYALVQRACAEGAPRFRDLLVYSENYRFSAPDKHFLHLLADAQARLAGQKYE